MSEKTSPGRPETVRVVSWNLGHNTGGYARRHEEAWDYLLEELRPDVALVQEAVPPDGLDRSVVFVKPWAKRPWGSAIVTAPGRIRKAFAETTMSRDITVVGGGGFEPP